jgi:hypothetical protein
VISEEQKRELQTARRGLEQAAERFRKDPTDREATLNTISSLIQIACVEFGLAETDPLMAPANALITALCELEIGKEKPILKKTKTALQQEYQATSAVKALAVLALDLLMKCESQIESCRRINKILQELGFSTHQAKTIKPDTVRRWRDEVRNPKNAGSELSNIYKLLKSQPRPCEDESSIPERIRCVETQLRQTVEGMGAAGLL